MSDKKHTDEGMKSKKFNYTPFSAVNVLIIFVSLIMIGVNLALLFVKNSDKDNSDNTDFYIIFAAISIAYICILAIILISDYLYHKSNFKRSLEKLNIQPTSDLPLGIFAVLKQPVTICNDDGKIIWMNRSFAEQSAKNILVSDNLLLRNILDFHKSEFKGKELADLKAKLKDPELKEEDKKRILPDPHDLTIQEILTFILTKNCGVTAQGHQGFSGEWTIRAHRFTSNGSNYNILVFTEDTEYNRLQQRFNDDRARIAYIAVDNLSEIAQSDQENYRSASTQVAAIIKKWAIDHNAFLKEFERDKYVAVLTDKAIASIERGKFQLLEKVGSVKIDSEKLFVTVSVGVSPDVGSLEEKDKAAQSALEMALQRGGNQAVVLHKNQPVFYGAKTITSLQRSGVRHRVFADKLMNMINECNKVVIMGHKTPDFDAVGACLGLARLAMSAQKSVAIVMSQTDPNLIDCFNLLSRLPEYSDVFIDVTSAQDMVDTKTLVICADVNNPKNFEAPDVTANARYLYIIDHHRQSENTPKVKKGRVETLIVPSASSACELVSEILELELPQDVRLTPEEATIMFAGLLLDTKNFTRNTQVPTFGAAIYLRNHGADPTRAQSLFRVGFDDFRQESAFANDLEIYNEFIVIAKEESSESSPAKRITAAKTADKLLNIKNARASFVISRMMNDVFISARSDGSVNVQLIMENMGGGGHYNAAATWLKETTVSHAENKLKECINQYFGLETPQDSEDK